MLQMSDMNPPAYVSLVTCFNHAKRKIICTVYKISIFVANMETMRNQKPNTGDQTICNFHTILKY